MNNLEYLKKCRHFKWTPSVAIQKYHEGYNEGYKLGHSAGYVKGFSKGLNLHKMMHHVSTQHTVHVKNIPSHHSKTHVHINQTETHHVKITQTQTHHAKTSHTYTHQAHQAAQQAHTHQAQSHPRDEFHSD